MRPIPPWLLAALGPIDAVHAVFDPQDSGCVSFGITRGGVRCFVKIATTPESRRGLGRAATLHDVVQHPTIARSISTIRSRHGTALVYPWVEGQQLYAPRSRRAAADGAPRRFRELAVGEIGAALDDLFDAHCALAAKGFVSSDFYDGSLLYDFDRRKLWLIDLDEYRSGPFTLQGERAAGSTRFMAPEEFVRGATIDERTTVHHLARAASILLDEGDDTGVFRGSRAQHATVRKGQAADPEDRFQSVRAFVSAWRTADRPPQPRGGHVQR